MTISNNVSFQAQSTSQIGRLNDLKTRLDELQRQATTQKKHANYSGYGTESITLQSLRHANTMTQGYMKNIESAASRMTMMSDTMTKISKLSTDIVHAINTGDTSNMDSVNQLARQNLEFIEDLLNQQYDGGRYLFAGADVSSPPFVDDNTLNLNFLNQVNAFLANPALNADTTLTAATDAFTSAQLGLNTSLATSGNVTMRIDKNVDLDYTIKADHAGLKDIINSLAFLANLRVPDPAAGDVATTTQFKNVLAHVNTVLSRGIQSTDDINQQLADKFNLLNLIKDSHTTDSAALQTQLDQMENIDPSTAIISMQALQTQLSASYQITKIVSQMSLVNFM